VATDLRREKRKIDANTPAERTAARLRRKGERISSGLLGKEKKGVNLPSQGTMSFRQKKEGFPSFLRNKGGGKGLST